MGLDQVSFTCITYPDGTTICVQDAPLQQSSSVDGSGGGVSAGGFAGGRYSPLLGVRNPGGSPGAPGQDPGHDTGTPPDCVKAMNDAANTVPSSVPEPRQIVGGVLTAVITFFLPEAWGGGSALAATTGIGVGIGENSAQNALEGGMRGQAALIACYASQGPLVVPVGN